MREQSDVFRQALDLPPDGRVWLRHARGSVRILPAEGREVQVEAEMPPGLTWEVSRDEKGEIHLRSIPAQKGQSPAADCTLRLPPDVRLRVHLIDGCLHLENITTRARLETVSADISLETVRGNWHLQTLSGDIHAHALEGGLYVQTVSGDVRMHACRISEMQAHAVEGEFLVETPLLEGPYAFHTVSGAVVLRLSPESHCDLDFSTLSGRMEIAHSGVYFPRQGTHRQVMIGDGGAHLRVTTLSGNLWIVSEAMPVTAAEALQH